MTRQERKNSITKSALGFTQMAQLEQTLVIGIMIGKLEKAAEEEAKAKEQSRQKTAQEVGMQKDFNRLRTGFVGACAALALMQGCVNDVKYVKLHQEYQHHLKVEAEFLQDLVLILQSGHLDSDQIVSKFEQEIQQQILNIGHHSDLGKMKFRSL